MKLGTIGALAIGIFLVLPEMHMPALSRFINGTGPIFAGNIFPFCFITIACGAISGFHSLIASGTTPKMIARENHARSVGYGCMLLESAVAIMAMIAACTLEPGVYFSINSSPALGATPEIVVKTISDWGFPVTVEEMKQLSNELGEKTVFGRAGGAPTLAVGMAHIFSRVIGGPSLMALWYHFAIMFEALFILTTIDAGTRVGRFLIQSFLAHLWKPLGNIHSYPANVFSSAVLVSAWGYFLYFGVVDKNGGINSLWPLFGIANQLLAVVALCLATTVLIKMEKKKFVWVTLLPMVWLICVTFTAGIEKIFSNDSKIGFLKDAQKLTSQLLSGAIAADKIAETHQKIFNDYLDIGVAGIFLILVSAILFTSMARWIQLWKSQKSSMDLREEPPVWLPEATLAAERASSWGGVFGAFVLGLGLAKQLSGQTEFENHMTMKAHTDSCCEKDGAVWANLQEKKFSSPRCC
jgi:carbon starvation protein